LPQSRNLDDVCRSERFRLAQSVADIPGIEDALSLEARAELTQGES
jgi:hypothetical protein